MKLKTLLAGFSTVLEIRPPRTSGKPNFRGWIAAPEDDGAALAEDWRRVGEDLADCMKRYGQEKEE